MDAMLAVPPHETPFGPTSTKKIPGTPTSKIAGLSATFVRRVLLIYIELPSAQKGGDGP
jgi:hypothetical protein